jgi:hypothetical protein
MDDETTGTPSAEEPTEVTPPDAGADTGATVVHPAAEDDTAFTVVHLSPDEGATETLSGESADVTTVLPAGGEGGAAPPPYPRPTVVMTHPQRRGSRDTGRDSGGDGDRGGSNTWWIVLLIIILAAAAAAALWFFVLRPKSSTPAPTPSPTAAAFAWAGTWTRTDGGGGGVVVQQSGNVYQITVYDSQLQAVGVATSQLKAGSLQFTIHTQQQVAGLTGPLTVSLTPGQSADRAQMLIASPNQNSVSLGLQRTSSLLPASPSASTSPSVSPPGSPSVSPTPSPSTSISAEQQVINGVTKLQVGVITWSTNNSNLYPTAAEVSQQGGVAQYAIPWPTNPYTGQPMKPGTQPGDFVYQQLSGGQAYSITGHLANGLTNRVPRPRPGPAGVSPRRPRPSRGLLAAHRRACDPRQTVPARVASRHPASTREDGDASDPRA